MLKDKRCAEIKKNPDTAIIKFFECGWLGAAVLKASFKNARIYSGSKGHFRNYLDNGTISETDYTLAVEESFLYGKADFSVWKECVIKYILFKIQGKSPLDDSDMFFDENALSPDALTNRNPIESLQKTFDKIGLNKKFFWIFDAGDKFQGNPKWLFLYVNKFRPDIMAVWLTDLQDTVQRVRDLGYYAFKYGTKEAEKVKDMAGVYVVENVKEHIPSGLEGTVMLNLFHGVGCKRIERNLHNAFFSVNQIGRAHV